MLRRGLARAEGSAQADASARRDASPPSAPAPASSAGPGWRSASGPPRPPGSSRRPTSSTRSACPSRSSREGRRDPGAHVTSRSSHRGDGGAGAGGRRQRAGAGGRLRLERPGRADLDRHRETPAPARTPAPPSRTSTWGSSSGSTSSIPRRPTWWAASTTGSTTTTRTATGSSGTTPTPTTCTAPSSSTGGALQLTWGLTRVDADLAGPGGKWFEERTSDSGRVGARLDSPALPAVSAGYSWFDSTDRYGDEESHDRNVQQGTATLGHSTPVFSVALQYAGEWSAGNWAGDDYQLDTIYTEGTARLGGTATFTVSDQYYQRTPTSTFATALTSDFHSLQAALRDLPSLQEEQFVRYVYARSLQSVPSQPTLETERQRLDLQREFKLASEYSLRPRPALSLDEQRNGTTGSRTAGEWATVYFRWLRRGGSATYDLQAGPVVGFLQDDPGTSSFGHGVSANGTVTLPLWDGFTGGGNYALSYSNNLGGARELGPGPGPQPVLSIPFVVVCLTLAIRNS
ncbi:MAG: hypothetical protein MZU95_09490, partial [Desulfomicrobium escambiense]|nr:hypothetical protein [Desulfomicrobium escambiense]